MCTADTREKVVSKWRKTDIRESRAGIAGNISHATKYTIEKCR
jgi:hypothetical protein